MLLPNAQVDALRSPCVMTGSHMLPTMYTDALERLTEMIDLIIRNGVLVDGIKTPRYLADEAIQGDRIVQIGNLAEIEAHTTIDARGKIVAPGFVDVHNHSNAWLLKTPHLFSKTSQGFTTEVIMADGISYAPVNRQTVHEWIYYLRALNALRFEEYRGWETLAEYMALLDGTVVGKR